MTKRPETLVVNVWNAEKDPDNPVEELEATWRDTYDDCDDGRDLRYHQYGAERSNGEYLEIRIPID